MGSDVPGERPDLNLDQWIKAQRAKVTMTSRAAFAQGWLLGAFSAGFVVLVATALEPSLTAAGAIVLAAGLGALTYTSGWGARPLSLGAVRRTLQRLLGRFATPS